MATEAVRLQFGESAGVVAGGAFEAAVRAGEREPGYLCVVESRDAPVIHAVALSAVH
jgi:hypothetical protein